MQDTYTVRRLHSDLLDASHQRASTKLTSINSFKFSCGKKENRLQKSIHYTMLYNVSNMVLVILKSIK